MSEGKSLLEGVFEGEFRDFLRIYTRWVEVLEGLGYLEGTSYWRECRERRGESLMLLEGKIFLEARYGLRTPVVVVILGGTNVGKSTVFNVLLGERVSLSAAVAAATRFPAVYVHEDYREIFLHTSFLKGFGKRRLENPELLHQESRSWIAYYVLHRRSEWREFVWMDSPDVDSNILRNAEVGRGLLRESDVAIFVKTDQKYLDLVPLQCLRQAHEMGKEVLVVLNKMEGREEFEAIVVDLQGELRERVGVELGGERFFFFPFSRGGLEVGGEVGDEVRRYLCEGLDLVQVKRRSFLGSLEVLRGWTEELVGVFLEESEVVERVHRKVEDICERRRKGFLEYVKGLMRTHFWELDEAVARVLRGYKIPVMDDVVDRVRSLVWGLWGRGERGLAFNRMEERKVRTLEEILKGISEVVREVNEYLRVERKDCEVCDQIYVRLRGGVELDVAKLRLEFEERYRELEVFVGQMEVRIRQWLEEHPQKELWLKVFQYGIRGGVSLAAVLLTGGLGVSDLVWAPLGLMGSRWFVDRLAPPSFFREFEERIIESHMKIWEDLLRMGYLELVYREVPLEVGYRRRGEVWRELEVELRRWMEGFRDG